MAFIDKAIEKLDKKYDLYGDYNDTVTRQGAFIIISNHPLGGIDGLVLLDIICRMRIDSKIEGIIILTNIELLGDLEKQEQKNQIGFWSSSYTR